MSKPSILPFVLVVTIPIGLFLAGIVVIVVLSATVWDTVNTDSFLTQLSSPLGRTIKNFRRMQIKGEATRLVAILNGMEINTPGDQPQAEPLLRRLMVISGEDFGTGFKGDEKQYTWKRPETPKEWAETMRRVNTWSDESFGTGFGTVPKALIPESYENDSSSNNAVEDQPPPASEPPRGP